MTTTDAVLAFDITRNIVERHSVATTDERLHYEGFRGTDGRFYSPFGIAQSVWNIPFYLAGRTAGSVLGTRLGPSDTLPKAAVALGTVPAVAITAWACFTLLITLGATQVRAATTITLMVFGTLLWPYSTFGFNQPLAGMFLWLSVLAAVMGRQRGSGALIWSGVLAGLAVLTRHEMVLAAGLIGLWIAAIPGPRRGVRVGSYAMGLLPMLAIWTGFNWWRFGSLFETGYLREPGPKFASSPLHGIAGLLFSPYASLLIYCPVVIVGVVAFRAMWRRDRDAAGLVGALFLTYLTFYGSLVNWTGGRSYGPRYLVALLPAVVLSLAFWRPSARGRVAAAVLLIASVLVQIPGVLVDYSKVREQRAAAGDTVAEDMRWSGMPLLLNMQALVQVAPQALRHLAGVDPPPAIRRDIPLSSALSSSLNLWWLHLFYLKVLGRGATVLVAAVMGLATAAAFARAFTLARALDLPVHPARGTP